MDTRAMEESQVALVRCDSYGKSAVKKAVQKAIASLGGFEAIFAGRDCGHYVLPEICKEGHLVLKPNLLAKAVPEKACTTHPEVFRAVAELLQEDGYLNLSYGDSPGSPIASLEKTAEGCGIKAVADELGIRLGDFEKGVEVEFPEGRACKHFVLCSEIAHLLDGSEGEDGGIINICKMKTHQLERITGAVKNVFGCVYGINKAASHAKHATAENFAHMLGDLNRLLKARLHIMDGIVAMEGNGPGSGDPIHMNVILASTDPVALDATFCHLVNLDPELVPTHNSGIEYGIGLGGESNVRVIVTDVPMIPDGSEMTLEEVGIKCGNPEFDVQRSKSYKGGFNVMRPFIRFLEKKPVIVEKNCIGCGVCVETCPLEDKAISLTEIAVTNREGVNQSRRLPVYDYNKCIKCYCCQEMCPEKAITVKKSLLARLADRNWGV